MTKTETSLRRKIQTLREECHKHTDAVNSAHIEIEQLRYYKAIHENEIREHGTDNCPFCKQDAKITELQHLIDMGQHENKQLETKIGLIKEALTEAPETEEPDEADFFRGLDDEESTEADFFREAVQ